MEAAALSGPRLAVAMTWPEDGLVVAAKADMRDAPGGSELIDQLHWGERVRILGHREGHLYVQADDHYLGWVDARLVHRSSAYSGARLVATALAPLRREPDPDAPVVAFLPAGARLPVPDDAAAGPRRDGWEAVYVSPVEALGDPTWAYISLDDTLTVGDLPQRPPTSGDLVATAEAFLGVPYLWGGTTALGLDCSGLVQQVYRLNGIRLDRDADQQAMEGRAADVPGPGDLLFFGDARVTHVALATGQGAFIDASGARGSVGRGTLAASRLPLLAVRRYLA